MLTMDELETTSVKEVFQACNFQLRTFDNRCARQRLARAFMPMNATLGMWASRWTDGDKAYSIVFASTLHRSMYL